MMNPDEKIKKIQETMAHLESLKKSFLHDIRALGAIIKHAAPPSPEDIAQLKDKLENFKKEVADIEKTQEQLRAQYPTLLPKSASPALFQSAPIGDSQLEQQIKRINIVDRLLCSTNADAQHRGVELLQSLLDELDPSQKNIDQEPAFNWKDKEPKV